MGNSTVFANGQGITNKRSGDVVVSGPDVCLTPMGSSVCGCISCVCLRGFDFRSLLCFYRYQFDYRDDGPDSESFDSGCIPLGDTEMMVEPLGNLKCPTQ